MTIVCIGDSQTTQGGTNGKYSNHLQQLLPNQHVINKGVSGNTLEDGRKRFQKDVLSLNPDIVVIQLGANDYWKMERPIGELYHDLENMVERCAKKNIKVIIASCFEKDKDEETLHNGKETAIELERARYALDIGRMEDEIARQYNCFYIPNVQIDINPNTKSEFWIDDNHPNNLGNEFVAKRILIEIKKALKQL